MTIRTIIKSLLVSLLLVLSCSQYGFAMTSAETGPFITIPTVQWENLKSEFQALNNELMECQKDLQKLKRPSTELVEELKQAESLLAKLRTELDQQKQDLTMLSKDLDESKTLLQKLKGQIDRERKIHKRQLWQNRFWFLLIGVGIGSVAK